MSQNSLPTRSEVNPAHTWNVASIFENEDAWASACTELEANCDAISAFAGTLNNATQFADLSGLVDAAYELMGKINNWGSLQYAVDITDQQAAAWAGRGQGLVAKFMAATAFISPELMGIESETLDQWITDEPRLAKMGHYIERLNDKRAHVRSAEVEQLLAQATDAFGTAAQTHSILMNADLKFTDATGSDPEVSFPISQATQRNMMTNPDRALRQSAWESYSDGHLSVKNSFANNYHGYLKRNIFYARARGYETVIHSSLDSNKIPLDVYHNVINVFQQRADVWQRYFDVRRQALGLDKLGPFDMWAPLAPSTPTISFEASVEYIAKGMEPLGSDYVDVLRRGCLEERWVDIYPNQGKRQGAFSSGGPGTHPFIMMSSGDDMMGLSTLAHELGHSMHSYLTWQNQPNSYARYSLFVAEVASNFNQALTRHHMLQTISDRNFRIAILEEAMANFYRYFFIMPTLARFELAAHSRVEQGKPITADILNGISAEFFQEGYGDAVEADRNRIGITWATFPHMYAAYYVFQYATGIAGAHALAGPIIAGEDGAVDRYLAFLKAGASDYPLPVLQRAGVDLAQPAAIESAFDTLSSYVDQLAELVVS